MKNPLLPIGLIVGVDILGLTIILPLLPFYAEKYGASPFVVGVLTMTYAVCQLISSPILGSLSDKVGRRPLLIVSQIGTCLGFVLLGFANSLPLIFLSRIIDGITAGNISLAQAYISDVTQPRDRAKAFGIIGIAFGMGFLIGPGVSGFLSQFGYHYPAFAAAALSFISILATYFLLPQVTPEKKQLEQKIWHYYSDARVKSSLIQFFCFAFSFSLFVSGFALFAERRFFWQEHPFGAPEVGYTFAYIGAIGIVVQVMFLGRLVRKFGERSLAVVGFGIVTLAYAILGLSYGLTGLVIAASLAAFANAVLRPTLTSMVSQNVDRNEQGVVMGVTQSLNSFAQIIAPLIAGALIEFQLLSPWAWFAGAVAMIGFLHLQSRVERSYHQRHEKRTVSQLVPKNSGTHRH